jgi:hypothetical protein
LKEALDALTQDDIAAARLVKIRRSLVGWESPGGAEHSQLWIGGIRHKQVSCSNRQCAKQAQKAQKNLKTSSPGAGSILCHLASRGSTV